MQARKGNGTATGEFSKPKPAVEVSLLPPQQKALEVLADKSRGLRLEWVEVRGIDPRPVRNLEAKHLIVTTESAGIMSARLTALGWKQSGLEKPEFEPTRPVDDSDEWDDDLRAGIKPTPEGAEAKAESIAQIANRPKVGIRPFGAPAEPPVLVQLAEADPRPPVVPDIETPLFTTGDDDDPEPDNDPEHGLSDEQVEWEPVRMRVEEGCGPGCVHEHVLVLLREIYPEIRDTVEILRRAKAVEQKLGLYKPLSLD